MTTRKTGTPSRLSGARISQGVSAVDPPTSIATDAENSWNLLKSYGIPLAAVAFCGAGAIYFSRRITGPD